MTQQPILRPLTWDDFDAYFQLYRIEHTEEYGNFNGSDTALKADWEMPLFEVGGDIVGIFIDDALVAFAEVRVWRSVPVRPALYGYVHPDYRGRGFGTQLTHWGIERAKRFIPLVPDNARVVLQAFSAQEAGQALFEHEGFNNTRQSWFMRIDLSDEPDAPNLPDGFRWVTMADEATVEDIARVHQFTFRDHRGSIDEPLEEATKRWQAIIRSREHFDPSLYAIIKEGDADVAIVIVQPQSDDDANKGIVDLLGVMPDYRRRGFGKQLLNFAFTELYKRGKDSCELNVDGSSITGATRLYEKAGMRVVKIYNAYELELRAGEELTRQ